MKVADSLEYFYIRLYVWLKLNTDILFICLACSMMQHPVRQDSEILYLLF